MKFVSTRDPSKKELSYCDTLLAGLAPDRGLFIPSQYPMVTLDELQALRDAQYTEVAFAIKKKIIGGDIPDDVLRDLVHKAYTGEKFPLSKNGNITPVREIEKNFYIQNLSLGPTAAFKDMAMQQLGQEMNYELTKR